MDEQVGRVRVDLGGLARPRVAGDDDAAPGARRADHLLGPHAGDGLAALQAPEVRALRDAERARRRGVEAPRPVVLDEGVAEGGRAVVDREGGDDVGAEPDLLVRLELGHPQREARAPEHGPHGLDQRVQPGRAVERRAAARGRAGRTS